MPSPYPEDFRLRVVLFLRSAYAERTSQFARRVAEDRAAPG